MACLAQDFIGELPKRIGSIFEQCDEWRSHSDTRTCIAIDIPSGVNGLTGSADISSFRADETITLLAPKSGNAFLSGKTMCRTYEYRQYWISFSASCIEKV